MIIIKICVNYTITEKKEILLVELSIMLSTEKRLKTK